MESKICSKCKEEKSIEEFYKKTSNPDGLRYWCKKCDNAQSKKWGKKNKKYRKKYYKNWREENKEYNKKRLKEWRTNNKKRIRDYERKRKRNKYEEDLEFRLITNLRNRINSALKGKGKSKSTQELLGCSIKNFKDHMENQFEEGMSWENYGKWHIDHIIPCAEFDLSDPRQQKICFHYTNLRPLWAKDNLKKGDSLDEFTREEILRLYARNFKARFIKKKTEELKERAIQKL